MCPLRSQILYFTRGTCPTYLKRLFELLQSMSFPKLNIVDNKDLQEGFDASHFNGRANPCP